jgi:DNA-binding beta-propeller fold protein YncE
VALSGEDQIDVIDVAAGRSINRIRLAGGDRPRDLALTPDGKLLVVVNPGSRTAAFVDPLASVEVGRVRVGDDPTALVLDRSATRAYVLNRRGNPTSLVAPTAAAISSQGGITVLDLANRAVVASLTTDPEPVRAAVNRAGSALYVVCAGSQFLSVYSLPDLALVNRIFVGLGTRFVKVDSRTDLIYVGAGHERELHVYDPYSALPVDDFAVPDAVGWAAIDDLENALFTLLPERRGVAIVDLTSRKTLSVIEVGSEPYAVVLSGERD